MKRLILIFALSAALSSCTGIPPVTGTIASDKGEVRVLPDGRVEIVVEPLSGK